MVSNKTDKQWEAWGEKDPYRGVLTQEKYQISKINSDILDDFFESGEKHIEKVLADVKEHLDKDFVPERALDFGCGVGRLLIPLSKLCEEVVGIDVSDSMLAKADKELKRRDIHNCQLVKSDDELSLLNRKFNLIHSYIVFQHIPVKRGEKIIAKLLDSLEEGGVGILHFIYHDQNSPLAQISKFIKTSIPFSYKLKRILKGENLSAPPPVEMNCYDLRKLYLLLQNKGFNKIYSRLDRSDKYGEIVFFFQK